MGYVEEQLFKDEERFTEDVFAFSETIDSLVEARVTLEDFLSVTASSLGRAVEGEVFGQRLKALPEGTPQRVPVGLNQSGLSAVDVAVRIDPPLPAPVARFIRQRMIHALRVIAHDNGLAHAMDDDADRIRSLLSASGTAAQRVGVLQQLGLDNARSVTVVAVAGARANPKAAEQLAAALAGGSAVLTAYVEEVLAVLLRTAPSPDVGVPEGMSLGLGEPLPPGRIHDSWEGAKTALRFSLPSRRSRAPYRMIDAVIVDVRAVGSLRVLAEAVDRKDIRDLADIRAIHQLAQDGPPDTLNVLEAVSATESIRRAASLVHLHHNTVAHRVETAEKVLGFTFRENYGRTRLLIGLTLYRLSRSSLDSHSEAAVRRPSQATELGT